MRRLLIQFVILALRGATPAAVGFLTLGMEKSSRNCYCNFPSNMPFSLLPVKVLFGIHFLEATWRDGLMLWQDVNVDSTHNTDKLHGSQSKPVSAVRIRNIWMNASPHHFHPRVLVKYGLISWCLAETIFMIYIWHHWSHKISVVMSENCIVHHLNDCNRQISVSLVPLAR